MGKSKLKMLNVFDHRKRKRLEFLTVLKLFYSTNMSINNSYALGINISYVNKVLMKNHL